jgi:hypothetical protein
MSTSPFLLGVGTVVHMRGCTRRYVVIHAEAFGEVRCLSMVALSGSVKGCYPTGVSEHEVEHDGDQTLAFSGAAAGMLRRKYEDARRSPFEPQASPTLL